MPKIIIDYEFGDLNMEPNEDLDIYVDGELGQAIGFIKIHVMSNGKILIMANGENRTMDNIIFEPWVGNLDYKKRVKEICFFIKKDYVIL